MTTFSHFISGHSCPLVGGRRSPFLGDCCSLEPSFFQPCGSAAGPRIPGAYRYLAIPVPIPNTVVKQVPPMIVLSAKVGQCRVFPRPPAAPGCGGPSFLGPPACELSGTAEASVGLKEPAIWICPPLAKPSERFGPKGAPVGAIGPVPPQPRRACCDPLVGYAMRWAVD